ncbi:hypothetical protein SCANM63S_09912 [Streptomyces canarius]
MTASTPLWGELADRHSKKTLVQTALWIYIAGSVGAGLAPDAPSRERVRAAWSALAQIVMAVMVSPASAGVTRGTWARPSPSFLYCAPLACVAFVVTLFIRENTLRAAHRAARGRGRGTRSAYRRSGRGHGDSFRRLPEGSGAVDGSRRKGVDIVAP